MELTLEDQIAALTRRLTCETNLAVNDVATQAERMVAIRPVCEFWTNSFSLIGRCS